MKESYLSLLIIPLLMGSLSVSPDKTKFMKAQIGNKTYKLEIADTLEKKGNGLSNRASLPKNQGMLFPFNSSAYHPFWMKEMRFPLDFIWLENNTVVDITENVMLGLEPFSSRRKHNKVIELNAGQIKENQLKIGDSVYFHR